MDAWLGLSKKRPSSPSPSSLEPPSKKWLPEYEAQRAKVSPDVVTKWLSKYKWLSTSKTKEGNSSESSSPVFFCTWCEKTGKSNSFASGKLFHFLILIK